MVTKILMTILAVLLAGCSSPTSTSIEDDNFYVSGESFVLLLMAPEGSPRHVTAMAYAVGVSDFAQGSGHCSPMNTSMSDVLELVALYIAEHPATMRQPAAMAILAALRERYPCDGTPAVVRQRPAAAAPVRQRDSI